MSIISKNSLKVSKVKILVMVNGPFENMLLFFMYKQRVNVVAG